VLAWHRFAQFAAIYLLVQAAMFYQSSIFDKSISLRLGIYDELHRIIVNAPWLIAYYLIAITIGALIGNELHTLGTVGLPRYLRRRVWRIQYITYEYGFCYLNLFPAELRDQARYALGSNPMIADAYQVYMRLGLPDDMIWPFVCPIRYDNGDLHIYHWSSIHVITWDILMTTPSARLGGIQPW
jgi:hypothetical protein